MRIQIWCKTHECPVGEVDPDTPVFEYNENSRQFDIRWDNTYCHMLLTTRGQAVLDHEYLFGVIAG